MKSYGVHMENWQRYEPAPKGATFVDHVVVYVDANSADDAAKAAKSALGIEWKVRCVNLLRTEEEAR